MWWCSNVVCGLATVILVDSRTLWMVFICVDSPGGWLHLWCCSTICAATKAKHCFGLSSLSLNVNSTKHNVTWFWGSVFNQTSQLWSRLEQKLIGKNDFCCTPQHLIRNPLLYMLSIIQHNSSSWSCNHGMSTSKEKQFSLVQRMIRGLRPEISLPRCCSAFAYIIRFGIWRDEKSLPTRYRLLTSIGVLWHIHGD